MNEVLTADFSNIGLGVIQTYGRLSWCSYCVRAWGLEVS